MTTAFELGCLSAMEKVAVNSGPAGSSGRPKVKLGPNPNDLLTSNPDTKMYDAPYWNSFGTRAHNNLVGGLASIGDAAIGAGNFIGNAASTGYDYATAPGRAIGDIFGSLVFPDKLPAPTAAELTASRAPKPRPYGLKDEPPRPYGPAGKSQGRVPDSYLISPAPTEAELAAAKMKMDTARAQKMVADNEAELLGSPVLRPSEKGRPRIITQAELARNRELYGQPQPKPESKPAPEPKSETKLESKPEPKSEPKPTEQGGLMSYLKNPYVLGGLGIGALGLGGYGLYNHLNSKKKKKKESDSE